jgi:mono/diheme cytochrome c family protein
MLKRNLLPGLLSTISLIGIFLQIQCTSPQEKTITEEEMIKRGVYLVNFGGCNDCHTPKVFTDMGPIPDTTRLLSGYKQGTILSKVDTAVIGPGKWYLANGDLTAWVGPWGISFAANLTPDEKTGLGSWTEEMFINAMRNGLHLGAGKPILPPMPYMGLAGLKDEDLKSVFAYLQSIKPVSNKVPDSVSPSEVAVRYGK